MIYLDNSATTQPDPEVVEVYAKALKEYYGNPSSLHHLGVEAEQLLHKAREVAANILRAEPDEIIFTSGGTEGNNLAIFGVAQEYANRGKHVITSRVEHSSVSEPFKRLEELGYEVTYLPVDQNGQVSVNDVENALRKDTILVSIMHVNNELGTIQPIEAIGAIIKNYPKVLFHVDAVQSFGKIELHPKKWGVHLLSLSGHKFHGPKGVGLLYKFNKVKLTPLIIGGGQEQGVRPGTQNVPGIIALAKAMRISSESISTFQKNAGQLRQQLWKEMQAIDSVYINSPADGAPHILNISVPGIKPEVLLHALQEKGICVSTKSACASKSGNASPVLLATGMPETRAKSAIRISMSKWTTAQEMETTVKHLQQIIPKLIEISKV